MNILEVHLDKWDLNGRKGISKGHAGVGEGGWVDHNSRNRLIQGLLDQVDERTLVVALMADQSDALCLSQGLQRCIDVLEGRKPVEAGLALTEQIEVWPMEDPKEGRVRHCQRQRVHEGQIVTDGLMSPY